MGSMRKPEAMTTHSLASCAATTAGGENAPAAALRNLYFLSILTAIFLPMTLVTGIFGMNVAGLPGLSGGASFWW